MTLLTSDWPTACQACSFYHNRRNSITDHPLRYREHICVVCAEEHYSRTSLKHVCLNGSSALNAVIPIPRHSSDWMLYIWCPLKMQQLIADFPVNMHPLACKHWRAIAWATLSTHQNTPNVCRSPLPLRSTAHMPSAAHHLHVQQSLFVSTWCSIQTGMQLLLAFAWHCGALAVLLSSHHVHFTVAYCGMVYSVHCMHCGR